MGYGHDAYRIFFISVDDGKREAVKNEPACPRVAHSSTAFALPSFQTGNEGTDGTFPHFSKIFTADLSNIPAYACDELWPRRLLKYLHPDR
jgi:hypothetical protein